MVSHLHLQTLFIFACPHFPKQLLNPPGQKHGSIALLEKLPANTFPSVSTGGGPGPSAAPTGPVSQCSHSMTQFLMCLKIGSWKWQMSIFAAVLSLLFTCSICGRSSQKRLGFSWLFDEHFEKNCWHFNLNRCNSQRFTLTCCKGHFMQLTDVLLNRMKTPGSIFCSKCLHWLFRSLPSSAGEGGHGSSAAEMPFKWATGKQFVGFQNCVSSDAKHLMSWVIF